MTSKTVRETDADSAKARDQRPLREALVMGVSIPLRDGVELSGTLYLPRQSLAPTPVIVTMTPYVAQMWHSVGMRFAAAGFAFLAVDVRGRGNSQGIFKPNINEAADGHDTVEWTARQPFCDGQVAMWGGSYAGFAQWATASTSPAHLTTIAPVASPCFGVDFPTRGNIASAYWVQWLTLVWGRASQEAMFFGDTDLWAQLYAEWFESGDAFAALGDFLPKRDIFDDWLASSTRACWDRYNPNLEQYRRMTLPVLVITGACDGNQTGTLTHYRSILATRTSESDRGLYLVIGPWDHAGTRSPQRRFEGLEVGPASCLDLIELHCQWYRWTMLDGPKPRFLRDCVTYYVIGEDHWRYAASLEAVTVRNETLFLGGATATSSAVAAGALHTIATAQVGTDQFRHDPTDTAIAKVERAIDPADRTDPRLFEAFVNRRFVFDSAPYADDVEIAGFFSAKLWLSLDQPDADLWVTIYDVAPDGAIVRLVEQRMRARYRRSLEAGVLIGSDEPLAYCFQDFPFIAYKLRKDHHLRLVVAPSHSIYWQKNFCAGGDVGFETAGVARIVTVKMMYGGAFDSQVQVPIGRGDD